VVQALYEANVIDASPENVRRVVIDLEAGAAARLYIETFAQAPILATILDGKLRVEDRPVVSSIEHRPVENEEWECSCGMRFRAQKHLETHLHKYRRPAKER